MDLMYQDETLGWSLFGPWYEGMTDEEIAREVFKIFVAEAKDNWKGSGAYPYSVADLYNYYNQKKQLHFITNAITIAELSKGDVEDGMEALAKKGGGEYPIHAQGFVNAIQGKMIETPFIDQALKAAQAAQKVAQTASKAVEETVSLGSNINKYFPYVLGVLGIGAVAFVLMKLPDMD